MRQASSMAAPLARPQAALWPALLLGAALLAGCGGGDSGSSAEAPKADPLAAVPGSASQTTQGAVDYQLALAQASSDTREPLDVSTVTLASSDTDEPKSVD
ncbi:hypothetical protein [Aquabacterium sp. OR-4]|uniref:hypothetical protein n=1 Tax=Aquabacterium sp. OR-4 TaxID=2978127 RepID=UPI0021B477E0|nr:hypothetical protein [Aquabacterium sp. OR-4]MDT7835276.1 hypothetical protein [Aquabacterium sp. OR-4]